MQHYCHKIINSGLDEISFSFDGADKGAYESIRVNAIYEETLFNIRRFLQIKKELNSRKPFTILQNVQLNGQKFDRREYRMLFRQLPVDKFYNIPAHNWAGQLWQRKNCKKHPCAAIWYRLAVGWDAKVYACCNDLDGKLLIGDLSTDSLMDVWNGAQMVFLRKTMLDNRYEEIAVCKDCDVLCRPNIRRITGAEALLAKMLLKI